MSDPRRISRALSAFDHASRRWTAVPLRPPAPSDSTETPPSSWPADRRIVGGQLILTTWNIQAVQSKRAERSRRILDCILDASGVKSSDIIFLQEVASDVRQSVLDDLRVRARFLTTDAEDDTAFAHLPAFATMTLLSKERFAASPSLAEEHGSKGAAQAVEGRGPKILLETAFRMALPSRELKDALCVDVRAPARPGQILRLLNAQLDSHESPFRRATQVRLLDSLLRERGCGGGVIAGDLIAPTLIEKYGLVDASAKLRADTERRSGGATRGVGGGLWNARWPYRLGNVAMSGLEPSEIEVLKPGRVDEGPLWSDHCGLRCTFTV